ncbi:MAG: thioredoxin family protein [Armatimonadia bacterium]|nr:thioredoxin family protein [Armatimonadia bacterium]
MVKIQVLGGGCAKCQTLAENAENALSQAGVEGQVEKVTDIQEIMSYKVMSTPALAIDGEVKVAGKVPSADEIAEMLG